MSAYLEKMDVILVDVALATQMVSRLLGGDFAKVRAWMLAPNTALFEDSPMDVCLRGDGELLLSYLAKHLGG